MKKGTQHNYLATHYVKKSNMAIKIKDGCQKTACLQLVWNTLNFGVIDIPFQSFYV